MPDPKEQTYIVGEIDGAPVKDYGYDWAIAGHCYWVGGGEWALYRGQFRTRSAAIRDWNKTFDIERNPGSSWRNRQRAGMVKLVKVRTVMLPDDGGSE